MSFPEYSNKNWGIVVVHGLGTPDPGETKDAVCAGIRGIVPEFAPAQSSNAPVLDKRASVAAQDWAFADGGRARVAEAFWGDLSLVRGTAIDMLLALCINLYGAVYVNSRTLQNNHKFIRVLPAVPFYLVRWVVLPLHLLALALALPMALWIAVSPNSLGPWSGDYLTSNNGLFLWLTGSIACAAIVAAAWLRRREQSSVRPQAWDFAAAVAVAAVISALCGIRSVGAWFQTCAKAPGSNTAGLYGVLQDLFAGRFALNNEICLLIVSNTPINRDVTGIGRYIALNEFVGDVAFFLTAGIVLVYIVLAGANALIGRHATARAMFFVGTVSIIFVFATAMLLELIDFVTRTVQFWGYGKFEAYWYHIGFVVWLVAVGLGAAVSFAWRKRRRGAAQSGSDPTRGQLVSVASAYGRLIVSEIFQFTVIAVTLLFIIALL